MASRSSIPGGSVGWGRERVSGVGWGRGARVASRAGRAVGHVCVNGVPTAPYPPPPAAAASRSHPRIGWCNPPAKQDARHTGERRQGGDSVAGRVRTRSQAGRELGRRQGENSVAGRAATRSQAGRQLVLSGAQGHWTRGAGEASAEANLGQWQRGGRERLREGRGGDGGGGGARKWLGSCGV
eukprot:scaffold2744_cov104-Isochrysis_galbana.AAC.1